MAEEAQGPGADALRAVIGATAAALGVEDAKVSVSAGEDGLVARVTGSGVEVMEGRDGETVDALQYLCGQIASRAEDERVRVIVDVGDYRARRAAALERLAKRAAGEALEHGDEIELDAMAPHDRRIVHMALKDIPGIVTRSEGEEPRRRIVIEPAD